MLFTVGHEQSYDLYLQECKQTGGRAFKKGCVPYLEECDGPYLGGFVAKTPEDAYSYLSSKNLKDYAIYVLDATLKDTYQVAGEVFLRLKRDVPILYKYNDKH